MSLYISFILMLHQLLTYNLPHLIINIRTYKLFFVKYFDHGHVNIKIWKLQHHLHCKSKIFIDQTEQSNRWNLFWLFWRVREIGPPFSAEASCQVDAFPGQNEAFTFDLTIVERWPRSNFLDLFHHSQTVTFWFIYIKSSGNGHTLYHIYICVCPLPVANI